ncbi:MAG: TlyA family RNA methyltransferase [Epsilonproteobacteria bacterium]|nr:TlyA family RNA methyltransferase [Campylobacterota bacterium]
MRLDAYLVQHNYFPSKNKAKEAILNSQIKVNNQLITKPAFNIVDGEIEILTKQYVSRAAWKLKNYIDEFHIDIHHKIALDIGSSTGGFSEVLLEYGVDKVVCVDVGQDQLHHTIKNNPKVKSYEQCDIRDFQCLDKFDIIVSDVSFISLFHIIDKIDELSSGDIILLFKPQFEVGKNIKRNKKGVVTDTKAIQEALECFVDVCKKRWKLVRVVKSSILGKNGNEEYITHFCKSNP